MLFPKLVLFMIKKEDVTKVVDSLSKYKCGIFETTELSVRPVDEENPELYEIALKVNKKYLEECLTDIVKMSKDGMFVDRLLVV